jgi:transcriptional regulator with XRE-family HTH domain
MNPEKTGALIKELRTQKNMTQKELAEKINCTDKAVSRWETGRGIPEVALLIPLSKVLDISVNELLSGERFASEADGGIKENSFELVAIPEIINKADENIVSVLTEADRKIKKKNKDAFMLLVLLCVQALIFFVLPDMTVNIIDPAALVVGASVINMFLVGLVKNKIKWTFPALVVLMFIGYVVCTSGATYSKFILVFAIWYIAGALAVMLVSILLSTMVRYIIDYIRNKYKIINR